eukprot:c7905_g1_i3.p1 GENE.c7905_g1_i3~~c7905_g1_i3.p1  ORF type:complete len:172 (+),score=37.42 c7905_g1_i3:188-703(+)
MLLLLRLLPHHLHQVILRFIFKKWFAYILRLLVVTSSCCWTDASSSFQTALLQLQQQKQTQQHQARQQAEAALAEKKKSLWAKKKPEAQEVSSNNWEAVNFAGDESRKNKFLSLMGAKHAKGSTAPQATNSSTHGHPPPTEKTLTDLERQFEIGRATTFGPRTGLGFRQIP